MDNKVINIEILGDHHIWKVELNDILDEITKFEKKMALKSEVLDKYKVEHFQNQFIIQRNAIADIKNQILKHDLHVDREADTIFGKVGEKDVKYHKIVEDSVNRELQIYKSLKSEFLSFMK